MFPSSTFAVFKPSSVTPFCEERTRPLTFPWPLSLESPASRVTSFGFLIQITLQVHPLLVAAVKSTRSVLVGLEKPLFSFYIYIFLNFLTGFLVVLIVLF